MNLFQIIVAILIVLTYLFELLVDILNIRHADPQLPAGFEDFLDEEKYSKSQRYLVARTKFRLIYSAVVISGWLTFFLLDGIPALNQLIGQLNWFPPLEGLFFVGTIVVALEIIRLPFVGYLHFGLEERFGFNRLTVKTFIFDQLKRWFVGGAIAGGAIFGVFAMFYNGGKLAWLYNWLITAGFFILFSYLVPILFLPLTYKFEPLEEGELRNKIETFAKERQYPYEGIYSVDASKRSSKANAFFVGFGKLKRIALFDTLIESHKPDEIVSVLAHEIGHNRKRHTLFNMAISVFLIGLFYFFFQLVTIDNPWLLAVLNLPEDSFYAGFIGAYLIIAYTPVKLLLSWLTNTLSRRFEYQADAYAAKTYGNPEAMSTALKRLSAHNLSNLTPHPLKEQLYYSHPPTIKRVAALQKIKKESTAKKE